MLRNLTRAALLTLASLCLSAQAFAQSAPEATASIAGRVTIEGEPAPGITVLATPVDAFPYRAGPPIARVETDAEGRYRLTRIPAGRILVIASAPTHVPARASGLGALGGGGGMPNMPGPTVSVTEGEAVENIDFALARGGVITGRVTDADGRPVVSEPVSLHPVERSPAGPMRSPFLYSPFMYQTDDRGIYRLYGLLPGRYRVSVGLSAARGEMRFGPGRDYFQQTFHPHTTEEERGAIVEVTAGGETTGIDITMGRREATYAVSGRVVDAETGQPIPRLTMGYARIIEGSRGGAGFGAQTNERGEFRLENIVPGRYSIIFAPGFTGNEYYSDPVPFEITESDVTGLVVRAQRGTTLSGVVTLEGYSDPAALARLQRLQLYASVQMTGPASFPGGSSFRPGPGGAFTISGLAPGRVNFHITPIGESQGFSILRVERDGVEQPREGIEIRQGEPVTGVRLVLGYGTGVIRGQVNITGGSLPPNANLTVGLYREGNNSPVRPFVVVDPRGRFQLENIPAGSYNLYLYLWQVPSSRPARPPLRQTVNVADGSITEANLTLDLSAPETQP